MMFPPQQQMAITRIDPALGIRTCQIIFFALIAGVLVFAGIAVVMAKETNPPQIAFIGLIFTAALIPVRFVVPRQVVASMLKKLPEGTPEDLNQRLFPIYQQRLIISLALLEGPGFLNCVGYLTEGQWFSLAAIAVLVILMSMLFPTLNHFENWAEDVKRSLAAQF